jgi:hypothetical protein
MLCVARLAAAAGHNSRTPADEQEARALREFSKSLTIHEPNAVALAARVVALSVQRQYRFGNSDGF